MFEPRTERIAAEGRYYFAYAFVPAGGAAPNQCDDLCLLQIEGKGIIGFATEFECCTSDIADACTDEDANRAQWFPWEDQWEWRAATLEEIKALGLDQYLFGSRKDMKFSSPIEPVR